MYFCNHASLSRLGFLFSISTNSFVLISNQVSISLNSGCHNHIVFKVQPATKPLLTAFWLDLGILILCNNKPLSHWPFQQQAAKQPPVSPKVTDGGTEKQVSLFRGLWFPELVSLPRIYQIDLLRNNLIAIS